MQSQKTENYAKAYIKAPLHRPAPPDPATMPNAPPKKPHPNIPPGHTPSRPPDPPLRANYPPTLSPKPFSPLLISQPAFTSPKPIMKTPERHHLRRFGIPMINFGLTSHLVLVFLLLIPKQVTNSCKTGAMLQSNTENQVAKMVFQK